MSFFYTSARAARRFKIKRIIRTVKNFIRDSINRVQGNAYPLLKEHL